MLPEPELFLRYNFGEGNIIRHTMYNTRQGKRRRYRCKACGKTFNSTWNTPYYRLHKPRREFDEVTQLTVEGVSSSSIARVKQISRNTVSRWQELASQYAERFCNLMLEDYSPFELQADELRTFVQSKRNVKWVFGVVAERGCWSPEFCQCEARFAESSPKWKVHEAIPLHHRWF